MDTQEQNELKQIAAQYGVGVVFDATSHDGMRRVQKSERVWNVQDTWGNGINDGEFAEGEYIRFHPGRDIKWNFSRVGPQAAGLRESGIITFDSLEVEGHYRPNNLFKGEEGLEDFANLIDVCEGKHARTVYDIAPDIFIAQELIKQTGEVVEEDLVKLTARDFLPFKNHNTWFKQYLFSRKETRGHGFSQAIDINSMAGIPTPKQSIHRVPVYRPLFHHFSGAMWSQLEIEQFAEARANGAPDFDIIREYTNEGQMDIRRTENALAYFGQPDWNIEGILPNTEIAHPVAAQQLGANALPAEDRDLIVDTVCDIFEASIDNASVDRILVGTRAWCYLNKTIFFDPASGSSRTLLSVIMEAVQPMGVRSIEWAPEMEFRQLQATRLEEEHGFSTALAERWSGGLATENVILYMNSNPASGTVGMGKELAVQPQETFRGDTEQRYLASSGGFDVRKPANYRVQTNVGPI